MKKFLTAALLSVFAIAALAQTSVDNKRKINVIGKAEQEVTPDIIYISISLQEYFKDNNNKNKVSIETLEKQLHDAAMKAGIKAEDFTINNISSYNYDWQKKKKDPGFLAAKQYRIKVSNLDAVNSLFDAVDAKGVQYSNIDGYDYSGKKELEKQLKIAAIKDARERAGYLAEALGDQLGKALSINESGYENYPPPMMRAQLKTAGFESADAMSPNVDFKKIKLAYEINAVFELL